MLPAAQTGSRHARDAPRGTSRSHSRLAGIGLLGSAEHGFYRTGESDGASWCLSSGTPHLGHFSAVSSTLGSCGMVARLLSFRAFPQSASSGIRTAPRARWPTSNTTLSPAYSGHGSGQNEPTMDSGRGPLLSLAAGPMLSLLRTLLTSGAPRNCRGGSVRLRADEGGKRVDEATDQVG